MSYSIIRVVKVKSKTNTRGIQRHIQRENKNYKGKRKIRTDAIKHIDGLITSDNVFFNQLSEEETK